MSFLNKVRSKYSEERRKENRTEMISDKVLVRLLK
jgi:hypothetical protein